MPKPQFHHQLTTIELPSSQSKNEGYDSDESDTKVSDSKNEENNGDDHLLLNVQERDKHPEELVYVVCYWGWITYIHVDLITYKNS